MRVVSIRVGPGSRSSVKPGGLELMEEQKKAKDEGKVSLQTLPGLSECEWRGCDET